MAQRARRRAELLKQASTVEIPTRVDICVVGGGASGLVAAIVAAEAGLSVVVLERDAECGRTILATGNGRCNFANVSLDPMLYNHPEFVRDTCGTSWLHDILDFFASCGLAWEEEGEGRLYPLSRQAASVRNVLLERAKSANVILAPARAVEHIKSPEDGIHVTYRCEFERQHVPELCARSLVISSGGGTTAYLGQHVPERPLRPVLCPVACDGPMLKELDGRRVRARARLERDGRILFEECGEVLFRSYGLSGIVVFNLSRHARPKDTIELDLLPTMDDSRIRDLSRTTLDGLLDPVIAASVLSCAGSRQQALELVKGLRYNVGGLAGQQQSQVTRGGLAISAFDSTSLLLQRDQRIAACGEALDIDGPCGGYNLAWAWKSGMVAGSSVARIVARRRRD